MKKEDQLLKQLEEIDKQRSILLKEIKSSPNLSVKAVNTVAKQLIGSYVQNPKNEKHVYRIDNIDVVWNDGLHVVVTKQLFEIESEPIQRKLFIDKLPKNVNNWLLDGNKVIKAYQAKTIIKRNLKAKIEEVTEQYNKLIVEL